MNKNELIHLNNKIAGLINNKNLTPSQRLKEIEKVNNQIGMILIKKG